jgi:hypothetical protein
MCTPRSPLRRVLYATDGRHALPLPCGSVLLQVPSVAHYDHCVCCVSRVLTYVCSTACVLSRVLTCAVQVHRHAQRLRRLLGRGPAAQLQPLLAGATHQTEQVRARSPSQRGAAEWPGGASAHVGPAQARALPQLVVLGQPAATWCTARRGEATVDMRTPSNGMSACPHARCSRSELGLLLRVKIVLYTGGATKLVQP